MFNQKKSGVNESQLKKIVSVMAFNRKNRVIKYVSPEK